LKRNEGANLASGAVKAEMQHNCRGLAGEGMFRVAAITRRGER